MRMARSGLLALLALFACSGAQASGLSCPLSGGAPGPLPALLAERLPGFGGLGGPSSTPPADQPSARAASASGDMPDCGAPPASSEPASLNRAAPSMAAGNPVDLASGQKYERVSDVRLPRPDAMSLVDARGMATGGAAPPLTGESLVTEFSRHYNSDAGFSLSLGVGWSHSYDTRLARLRLQTSARASALPAYEIQLLQADGRRLHFKPWSRLADGTVRYSTGDLADGLVEERLSAGTESPWVWRWPTGRRLFFNARGQLVRIVAADLDAIALHYDSQGRLNLVSDRQGRMLRLSYTGARLTALGLPDGGELRYRYDARGRLQGVRYPDGRQVIHHYDDEAQPYRLTGTTHPDGRRSRYRYDMHGRVISTQADELDSATRIELSYAQTPEGSEGSTRVKSAAGEAVYHWRRLHQGQLVLTESSGQACAQCPPTGWKLVWGAQGTPLEMAGWRLRYDALGRLVGLEQGDDASGLRWHIDYSADDPLARPQRIEGPSVIAGQRRVSEFRHNDRGQMVLRLERGHTPESSGSSALMRVVRMEYVEAGPARGKPARVGLVEIPLEANVSRPQVHGATMASKASVAAKALPPSAAEQRYYWDDERRLALIDYGEDVLHVVERDALGRPVRERLPDLGERRWHYDAAWSAAPERPGTSHPVQLARPTPDPIRPLTRASTKPPALAAMSARVTDRTAEPVKPMPVGMTLHTAGARHHIDADGQHTVQRIDDFGRIVEERIDGRLWRRVRYDSAGRPAELIQASGVTERLSFDGAGRLRSRERSNGPASELTRFHWQGLRLTGIEHPNQTTSVASDDAGRVTRLEHRFDGYTLSLEQHHDSDGRLLRRSLGDGRALLYRYDNQGRAQSISLQTAAGATPIELVRVAYRGDGLPAGEWLGHVIASQRAYDEQGRLTRLSWHANRQPMGLLDRLRSVARAPAPVDEWALRWDEAGRIESIARDHWEDRFGFDPWGRIAVRERHRRSSVAPSRPEQGLATQPLQREFFAYSPAGHLIGRLDREGRTHRHNRPAATGPGPVTSWGDMALRYGLSGRIEAITAAGQPGRELARYRYNALGERVAKTIDPQSPSPQTIRYLYHGRQLVAELNEHGRIRRHYVWWSGRAVAVIDPGVSGEPDRIVFLLGDHLGTPQAAVDSEGTLVWRADTNLYGSVARIEGGFDLPLRFPGQYADAESGLHDNYQRSYDPRSGRYLEPDPLGLVGGWNRYAYAGGNPAQAIDPLGLILFAFDGTGNTDPARAPDTLSNVARLYSLYDSSQRHYMSGVGIPLAAHGIGGGLIDMMDAGSARQRVDLMLDRLQTDVQRRPVGSNVKVDVIGFSRGAAMARDFANTVAQRIRTGHYTALQRCVSLNFIGLWDTVAQFGLDGQANDGWNLSIPPEAHVVVHAVAVNEHRPLFPVESILSAGGQAVSTPRGKRLELGFIGDHADIGGSHADGDLSDVALSWMYDQARAAGLPLSALSREWRTVSNPLLHDARSLLSVRSDRVLRVRDERGALASEFAQREAPVTGMNWAASQPMIGYFPYSLRGSDGRATLAGRVDMQAYGDWLSQQYALDVVY